MTAEDALLALLGYEHRNGRWLNADGETISSGRPAAVANAIADVAMRKARPVAGHCDTAWIEDAYCSTTDKGASGSEEGRASDFEMQARDLRVALEALQEDAGRRLKTLAREVSERLDWIVRDRREPDKVLANVSTARSVLIRELTLDAPANGALCGRLLVGRGSDTWDPECQRPARHDGDCDPDPSVSGAPVLRSAGEVS